MKVQPLPKTGPVEERPDPPAVVLSRPDRQRCERLKYHAVLRGKRSSGAQKPRYLMNQFLLLEERRCIGNVRRPCDADHRRDDHHTDRRAREDFAATARREIQRHRGEGRHRNQMPVVPKQRHQRERDAQRYASGGCQHSAHEDAE